MGRFYLYTLIFIFVAIVLLLGCSLQPVDTLEFRERNDIRIAVIGPMKSYHGRAHWNGALMAKKEINNSGGLRVGGRMVKVSLIKADSDELNDSNNADREIRRLIKAKKVDFIVGGCRTQAVLLVQDTAMKHKKIFFGCGVATPDLCDRVSENYQKYKYWFRISPANVKYLTEQIFLITEMVVNTVRQELRIEIPKIAVVAEDELWAKRFVEMAEPELNLMKVQIVGTWKVTDEEAEYKMVLSDIQQSKAQILFTAFSDKRGVSFPKLAFDLKAPVIMTGVNVAAERDAFFENTEGAGAYVVTSREYCHGVEYNHLTRAFVDNYLERFGELPIHYSDTYSAIMVLKQAIERADSLDPDQIVTELEKTDMTVPFGRVVFTRDHDLTYGPGYWTGLGIQWQDGMMKAVWPKDYGDVKYKGIVPLKLPPWMIEEHSR